MGLSKEELNIGAIEKIIKMFTLADKDFLSFSKEDVINGPNDRSAIGFDNHFPKKWLIEDFSFTEEEAQWFIEKVKQLHGNEIN